MKILSSHSYFRVDRKIIRNEQHIITKEKSLTLYQSGIKDGSQFFYLNDVLDISYKALSSGVGLLYLHTIMGLFSYPTKTSPEFFIHAFKSIKNR